MVIFFHFLLDKVFCKNLCKSLVINELRRAGLPAPRNCLILRHLQSKTPPPQTMSKKGDGVA